MGEWKYKAKNSAGKYVMGTMQAQNKSQVTRFLRESRLRPIYVHAYKDGYLDNIITYDDKGRLKISFSSGQPNLKDISIFTKQFSIMIERGVPLIQALNVLGAQQKRPRFGAALTKIRVAVENGKNLSDALSMFPKLFDELYISMVRAGEASGNLDVVLREIVKFTERSIRLRSQIRSASMYPFMIVSVAISITMAILIFLVPAFSEQYQQAGKALPAMTQFVIDISNFLQNYFFHFVGGLIGLGFLFARYRQTPKGRIVTDAWLLRAPIIGDLVRKIAVGRFAGTMATMLSSGVSILDALKICSEASGNKFIEDFVNGVRNKIAGGSNFSDPLSDGDLFPKMVVSMVTVGEQTGALDQTLTKIAEIYEEEVEEAVKNMMDLLQPLLIVGIGVVLGFVIIALYLPIMDSANLVGG